MTEKLAKIRSTFVLGGLVTVICLSWLAGEWVVLAASAGFLSGMIFVVVRVGPSYFDHMMREKKRKGL